MLNKTYSPKDVEAKWRASVVDLLIHNSRKGCPQKTLIMPPPNVTGKLHIGHALTFTLQDVWIKFWTMRGACVLAQPGLDHAGIATQMMIEKAIEEEGGACQSLGREKFLERAYQWKDEFGGQILDQLKLLGVSANWDRTRFTLDADISLEVRRVFVRLFQHKLIYKSERMVNWDPILKTALSDLEVNLKETRGKLWTIRYKLVDNAGTFIDISTTRPETLFGDMAVAVHPKDCRYQHLVGSYVHLPLTDRQIPIIADDRVEPEKGTGAVKITPAHDFLDFEVGKTHHLSFITVMDERGCLNGRVPEDFQGLNRFEAREHVLEQLKKKELLSHTEDIVHHVPFGERSGAVLEARLTNQWYFDVKPIAQKALTFLDRGKPTFTPSQYATVYRRWLENIEPWCVSRQLWWGHQIPAWYGPDGTIFVGESERDVQLQAQDYFGEPKPLIPDPDVLDTWFSSALWPLLTLGWPEDSKEFEGHYPTNLLITGFDIIFFWVARMVMMGIHFTSDVPFKDVYIHGLVRDQNRQKMSKTKGNVVNPMDVIETYGTDALRFTLIALATPGNDLAFNLKQVEGYRNFITKLWNAARFAEMHDVAFDGGFDCENVKAPLNQWCVNQVSLLVEDVTKALETYRFYHAASLLYQFVWHTFCDWYIELAKHVFLDPENPILEETKQTMGWTLGVVLRLLYPIVPFASSEIWSVLSKRKENLGLQNWPLLPLLNCQNAEAQFSSKWKEALVYRDSVADIQWLIRWVTDVRSIRNELGISPAQKISLFVYGASENVKRRFESYASSLKSLLRLECVTLNSGCPEDVKNCAQGLIEGTTFLIPLQGIINFESETKRLTKKRDQLALEKAQIDKRLSKEDFRKRAPQELVKQFEGRVHDLENQVSKLEELLARLSG
jgi:valyl-tRNA synthetase